MIDELDDPWEKSTSSALPHKAHLEHMMFLFLSSFKSNNFLFVLAEKPQPDGLALAFQGCEPGQSRHEAVIMARLGLAYLGPAGPGTALAASEADIMIATMMITLVSTHFHFKI